MAAAPLELGRAVLGALGNAGRAYISSALESLVLKLDKWGQGGARAAQTTPPSPSESWPLPFLSLLLSFLPFSSLHFCLFLPPGRSCIWLLLQIAFS